ncbi:transposase [Methylomonas sp. LWB]|uniref:REP-associated tyrosine transposase n=1 Tax=Methylomonas sp. LWB TaxID=1905845 RepID=UPI0008DAFCC4|nr:transposase [Methylomonas sp. LWB]OHX36463.1 transposase [Methylomonas sp. LWB]
MADCRRCYVPGGSYFFTVVTERREGILANDTARDCLREAIRHCRLTLPFAVDALVMMPDHIHTIWTLPPDDGDFSKRWGVIKKHFTQHWLMLGGAEQNLSASRLRYRRRGVWQRRFWDHLLRDERDYQNHFDYLHFNPVKHGLVKNVADWPYSSFHHWVEQGVYMANWGAVMDGSSFKIETAGE